MEVVGDVIGADGWRGHAHRPDAMKKHGAAGGENLAALMGAEMGQTAGRRKRANILQPERTLSAVDVSSLLFRNIQLWSSETKIVLQVFVEGKGMLLDHLIDYANRIYQSSNPTFICRSCTHPTNCKGGCKECLDDVHFHWMKSGARIDYNCQKLLLFYVCRYSYKYCSEILYALDKIEINKYPMLNILSLGCGATPDLMAFEYINKNMQIEKKIKYRGYDRNVRWKNIHKKIVNYFSNSQNTDIKFIRRDIFDDLAANTEPRRDYNVIILQYIISHLYNTGQYESISILYDSIIKNIIYYRRNDSPFLIIINDIDSIHKGRNYFWLLEQQLCDAGYNCNSSAFSFSQNCYLENSTQHYSTNNKFSIPNNIKENYACAIICNSAQLIIEVQ